MLRILLGFTRDLNFFPSKLTILKNSKKKQCAWCALIKKWLFLRFNKCFASFSSIVSFLDSYCTFNETGFRGSKIGPNPIGFYTWFWKNKIFFGKFEIFSWMCWKFIKNHYFLGQKVISKVWQVKIPISIDRKDFMKLWKFWIFFWPNPYWKPSKIFYSQK